MAKTDSTTLIAQEEQRNQLRRKLWRIRGLAEILRYAANENEDLPGSSVEEVAGTISDLVDEAQNVIEDMESVTWGKEKAKETPLPVELN